METIQVDEALVIVEGMSDIRSDLERKAITRRMKMGKMSKAKSGQIPNKVPSVRGNS